MFNSFYILIALSPPLIYLCWSDWTRHRLPNKWTMGILLVALACRLGIGGWRLFIDGVLAGMIGSLLLLILYLVRGLGSGDLKLQASVCCVLGIRLLPTMFFCMSIASLLLLMTMFLMRKLDIRYFKHYVMCLNCWKYDRITERKKLPPRNRRDAWIPFGIAISAGAWFSLVLDLMNKRLVL